jgi:hypothetical protein
LGEFVVIKDSTVLGYFEEETEAFDYMKENELGTFMVKKCMEPGTDIITFHRVAFA